MKKTKTRISTMTKNLRFEFHSSLNWFLRISHNPMPAKAIMANAAPMDARVYGTPSDPPIHEIHANKANPTIRLNGYAY